MTKYRAISPFLCMDMTYITCLLKEGFGFKDSTVLQVSKSGQVTVESGSQRDTKYEKLHDKTFIFTHKQNFTRLKPFIFQNNDSKCRMCLFLCGVNDPVTLFNS